MAERTNEMDAFERTLKDSLEHYEVPYNSADWAQMERALSSGVRGWGHGRALVAGLLLAGGLLIGGTAYFMGRDTRVNLASGTADPSLEQIGTTDATAAPEVVPASTQHPTIEAVETQPAQSVEAQPSTLPRTAQTMPVRPSTGNHPSIHVATSPAATAMQPLPPESNAAAKANISTTLFRSSMNVACPGSPVDFTVENMPEDGIYLWNFGDGSFSNKPNPQHTFTKPGSYQVMLSMSNTGMGTIHNKPSSNMIVIHEAPSAGFNVVRQEYPGQLPSVHFENRSLGGKTYHWDLGDGSTSTAAHVDHMYKNKGVYKVELTVTNETGCEDRKMKEVRIDKDFNLGAAASFSPNGSGKEATFMPEALINLTGKFQLAIYDPTGLMVYSTNDATHPWCGKAKNQGAVCAPGDYVWVVDVEGGNQAPETFTGKVKLLP